MNLSECHKGSKCFRCEPLYGKEGPYTKSMYWIYNLAVKTCYDCVYQVQR